LTKLLGNQVVECCIQENCIGKDLKLALSSPVYYSHAQRHFIQLSSFQSLSAEQMEHDLSTLGLSSDKIEIITKCVSSLSVHHILVYLSFFSCCILLILKNFSIHLLQTLLHY